MKSDYALSGDFGEQLQLDPWELACGDHYRRKGGGAIVTVIGTEQRRVQWVKIRVTGEERWLTREDFARHYEPFRLRARRS